MLHAASMKNVTAIKSKIVFRPRLRRGRRLGRPRRKRHSTRKDEVGRLVEIELKWALELDVRRAGLASGGSVPKSTAFPEPEGDQTQWSDQQQVRARAVTVRDEPDTWATRPCRCKEFDKPLELFCLEQRKVDWEDDQGGEMM
jgi:hypothetical protein